ncbi:class I SAM-dependent methyltransferase [Streptomyces sp. NPDC020607]|uniref:class I SAM-dependent methyltransferase n=1 Tax=Streptomyces sp. NPDC020607 TaxID=3365082 RepID=UPI00378B8E40
MNDQFDALGPSYEETVELPLRRYLEMPGILAAVGDVRGLSVLDVGCGSGIYTRCLKRSGARRVVGLDVSPGMLQAARERERQEQLGIDYVLGDAVGAKNLGTFDLAVAVYVLPYAETENQLRAMCQGIAGAISGHGRFVTATSNPHLSADPNWYAPYGFTVQCAASRTDGTTMTLTAGAGDLRFSATAYHWTRETHEQALKQAGFGELMWKSPQPTEEGLTRLGSDYWQRYIACPHSLILDCRMSGLG